jgi:hypothetical protein
VNPYPTGFRQSLDVRLLPDGRWELLQDLTYLSDLTKKAYTVPAGFITDFASVPHLPIVYLLAGNAATLASVVHDHLYQTAQEPKDVADRVFAEIMDRTGVPRWRRDFMTIGVIVGGLDYEMMDDGSVVKIEPVIEESPE